MNKKINFFLILLVILLIFNAVLPHEFLKESFSNYLPLKSLNYCGRMISFPNQVNSTVIASTRAQTSRLGRTDPLGICNKIATTGDVDASSSVVVENSLYYTLEKACLGLRFINYSMDETGKLFITFLHDSTSDRDNIAFLLLLNPLYVEFITNSSASTQGYRIDCQTFDKSWKAVSGINGNNTTILYSPYYPENYSDFISKYASHIDISTDKHIITLRFIPIIEPNKTTCDSTFNYKEANVPLLTGDDLESLLSRKRVVNLNVYYLNDIETSFQQPSRTINLDYDLTGSITGKTTIYYQDYDDNNSLLRKRQLTLNEKKFMNNLKIM